MTSTPAVLAFVRAAEEGTHGTQILARLRGLAIEFLYLRENILCELSAEDGEWPDEQVMERIIQQATDARTLLRLMERAAYDAVPPNETHRLCWHIFDQLADSEPFVKLVNWDRLETQS